MTLICAAAKTSGRVVMVTVKMTLVLPMLYQKMASTTQMIGGVPRRTVMMGRVSSERVRLLPAIRPTPIPRLRARLMPMLPRCRVRITFCRSTALPRISATRVRTTSGAGMSIAPSEAWPYCHRAMKAKSETSAGKMPQR